MSYPNVCIPLDGESLYSVLHRTAKTNHLNTVASLIGVEKNRESNNMTYLKGNFFEPIWKEISKNLRKDISNLVLNQFNETYLGIPPNEENIQLSRFYLQTTSKFCPYCIREKYYHHVYWDIFFVTICMKHNCFLIDKCPKCDARLKLPKLMNQFCDCGHCFMDEGFNIEQPNSFVFEAQETIQSLLFSTKGNIVNDYKETLSSKEYFHLLHSFAALLDSFDMNNPLFKSTGIKINDIIYFPKKNKIRDNYTASVISAVAHDLIIHPNQLKINALFAPTSNKRYSSGKRTAMKNILKFSRTYRDLYLTFFYNNNESINMFNLLACIQKKEIEQFSFTYMTLNDLVKYLGFSYKFIKHFVSIGTIPCESKEYYNQKVTVFNRKEIMNWKKKYDSLVDISYIRNHLNIGRETVMKIVKHHYIKAKHGQTLDGHNGYLFEKDEVDNFLNSLTRKANKIRNVTGWITLDVVVRRFNFSYMHLISLILDNKFTVGIKSELKINMKEIFLLEEEIIAYLSQTNHE